MKILMTNNALDLRGGSESYLETVSTELRRLGHEVSFFSPLCGAVAAQLRATGFDVFDSVGDLPQGFDVIHGQHTNAVGVVRGRFPRIPLVFATHSWLISPLEDPVPELGAAAYLSFNELTRRRLEANVATLGADIIRLTQPVAISFADGERVPVSPSPRRAVAVSRRLMLLPERLASACSAVDIKFEWIGGMARDSADARHEMVTADIVFAVGRTALEAMAMGRAVVVMDESTTGGWVSTSSYGALEADGFTGLESEVGTLELEQLLGQYSQELGTAARRLAVRHHAAQHHAARLVEIYSAVSDSPAQPSSPHTIALLANDRFAMESRAVAAEWQAARHQHELDAVVRDLAAARAEAEDVHQERDALREHWRQMAARRDRVKRQRDRHRRQRDRSRKAQKLVRIELEKARRSLSEIQRRPLVRIALALSNLRFRRRSARLHRRPGEQGAKVRKQ